MTKMIQWDNSSLVIKSEVVKVIGQTNVFVDYGDSGSCIWDETSALVGVFFAIDLSEGSMVIGLLHL